MHTAQIAHYKDKFAAAKKQFEAVRNELLELAKIAPKAPDDSEDRLRNPMPYVGPWKKGRAYRKNDVVSRRDAAWISMSDRNTTTPGRRGSRWQLLAKNGEDGVWIANRRPIPNEFIWRVLDDAPEVIWDMMFPVGKLTLVANRALLFYGSRPGGTYTILLEQDAIGGRQVTWPDAVRWPGSVTPILSTAPGAIDVFNFVYDGTVFYGTWANKFL